MRAFVKYVGLPAVLGTVLTSGAGAQSVADRLDQLTLPEGFEISIYAEVPGAREMAIAGEMGVVFVGTRSSELYAVIDDDRDGTVDRVLTMRDDLNAPTGLAYDDGTLYVSEQHRLTRYDVSQVGADGAVYEPEVLYDKLPDRSHHGTRATELGPDGKIYIAIGVPCNICMPDGIEDAIIRLDRDGSNAKIFASGIRNSVGMAFHPKTGELYFNDNGVDNMGDDSPPGEFNHAPTAGLFFGFPYYGGGHDRHREWADREPPMPVTFPAVEYQAHVAALGLAFVGGDQFPDDYINDAIVAQHGSWNRSTPIGYRLVRVRFDDQGRALDRVMFAEGWLREDGEVWGRPTDVEQLPDGSLVVADDYAGVLYRITYTGN
ncbi:MAG: sorbosone dehydrogenase [Rhodospirillaceae bacterium]|mgnify:CR=1 FL=1|nr:sorbosone dehydrogenase [Rhodospirillaceae bacterium]|tara:strand:+ start:1173 stop:2297 length:1125 start_codon:yes stop_codon:yes gene_type:complete